MISLSSAPKVIWDELNEERSKAVYWLEKQFGGAKGIDRERDRLLALAQRTRKDACSEVFKWRSKRGNRWVVYEYCRYFPEAGTSFSMPHAFCFYETIGSVGAFVPMFGASKTFTQPIGFLIFTSHFFLRAADRLGFEYSSEECLARFVTLAPMLSLSFKPADEKGVVSVDVRMPGAIGRGKMISKKPLIVEVRTCLKDSQLSSSQKRNVKDLMEYSGIKQQLIQDVAIAQSMRADQSSIDLYNNARKAYEKAHGNTYMFDMFTWAHHLTMEYIRKLRSDAVFDLYFLKQANSVFERLDMEFEPELSNAKDWATILPLFSNLARKFMKIMHVDGFNDKECQSFMIDELTKAYKYEQGAG